MSMLVPSAGAATAATMRTASTEAPRLVRPVAMPLRVGSPAPAAYAPDATHCAPVAPLVETLAVLGLRSEEPVRPDRSDASGSVFASGFAAMERARCGTLERTADALLARANDSEADRRDVPRGVEVVVGRVAQEQRGQLLRPADFDAPREKAVRARDALPASLQLAHGEVRWNFVGPAALLPESALREYVRSEPRTMAGFAAQSRRRDALSEVAHAPKPARCGFSRTRRAEGLSNAVVPRVEPAR